MKKFVMALLAWSVSVVYAQQNLNTLKVEAADTDESIMWKAAHVVPTARQWAAQENEFIAFVHFGPNTFTRMEWGTGKEDPKIFDLKELDTDQWCRAIKAAGMKMVILTVKHHDGFVLWQSRYTRHGIMSTSYQDGRGDVLKDLSASCRKYGLKLGVYLSPADLYQIESPDGLYGNGSQASWRTIPREVPGRPFRNQTRFRFEVDDYNEYFLNQLFELLTEYGPIHEVWFDGAHPKRKGGQTYNYVAWRKLIRTLAPEATIFGREDIRWCGNEAGHTRESEWNVIGAYEEAPDSMVDFRDLYGDWGTREVLLTRSRPYYLHYQPAEPNTSIREGWFYRDDVNQRVRTADDVFDIYERSVGGNSIFLLNIPPNREGRFSPTDVEVLEDVGRRIALTYGTDLLADADGPWEVLDDDPDTYLLLDGAEKSFVLTTPRPVTLNRFVLQEAVRTHSERVEQVALDAWLDGAWQEVARATNVGRKRILRFPDVTTSRLRVRIPASRFSPAISRVSAHYYRLRPPRIQMQRNLEGLVTIGLRTDDFSWDNWNQAERRANVSLLPVSSSSGQRFAIRYTTDGSDPDSLSTLYTAPVTAEATVLKAAAFSSEERGPVACEQFGFIKKGWKVLTSEAADGKHPAIAAVDEQSDTYWLAAVGDAPLEFAVDLGQVESVSGFAYTPPTEATFGLMAGGTVEVSSDGIHWQSVDDFRFGNLVNDPTRRFHYFRNSVKGRYVRLVITEMAGATDSVGIAELDIF